MRDKTEQLIHALEHLNTSLEVQWGRSDLLQRWIDEHTSRIEELSHRVSAHLARIDALLNR